MFSPLLCLALLLPSEPDAVTTAELTTRMFDLGPILQPRAGTPTSIALLPVPVDARAPSNVESPEPTELAADTVIDLVRNCVWPEEWEFEGRALDRVETETGTLMRVTLPAARMQDVDHFLQYLTETLNAETAVTVSVHRVLASPRPPRAIPTDAAGVAELQRTGQLGPARSFRMRLRPGRVEHTALRQSHTYVSDYDVEIAQASARAQPITRTFDTGTELSVRGDVLRDGRVAVQFAVADSAVSGPLEAIDLKAEAQFVSERGSETTSARCVLQSPNVRCGTVAGTAELAAGETVVVGALDPSASATEHAGIVVVVRVDSVAPKQRAFASGNVELRILNVGFASMSSLAIPSIVGNQMGWDASENSPEPIAPITIPDAADSSLIEAAVFASGALESPDVYVTTTGPFVFLRTHTAPADPKDRGEALEGRLMAGLTDVAPSARVDLRLGDGDDTIGWGRVSCSNRGGLALAGSQENYVTSWEVDVANNSSIAQPVTFMLPSALVARVTSAPTADTSRSVRVQFHARIRDGAKVVLDPQMPMLGIAHGLGFLRTSIDATRWLGVKDVVPFGMVEIVANAATPMSARLE